MSGHLLPLSHDLYKDGDPDIPDQIRDSNGDVTLALCRRCGQVEAELEEWCPAIAEMKP